MSSTDNTISSTYNNEKNESCGCGSECGCSSNVETKSNIVQEELSNVTGQTGCGCGSECGCQS